MLFLFEDTLVRNAATLDDHLHAFNRHSRLSWYPVNVWFGLPPALARFEFAAAVFHYSLQPTFRRLEGPLGEYLVGCAPYKVAFFQDEMWYFAERKRFLGDYGIDCLYSRHKPRHVADVYGLEPTVGQVVHYLAGYVSESLVERARRLTTPYADRPIDVGYRGRRLPFYLGRGAQEKAWIAERFAELAVHRGLRLDLSTREGDRLYGRDWDRFLAGCKSVLGVEGGVSVIDPTDRFRRLYEGMVAENPDLTLEEFEAAAGPEFAALEGRIDYRSLTPRHFESAAFGNLQILFEGRYDGVLQPWVHYVPLRKDFGNLDEVLAVVADPERASEITDRAYEDLIESGLYSYERFVRSVDERLIAAGVAADAVPDREADRRLRAYLADWNRLQSRACDLHDMIRNLPVDSRQAKEHVKRARAMVAERATGMSSRVDRMLPGSEWVRQARDRLFWQQLERELGERVPARPEFDPRPRRLSPAEWIVVAPAARARQATQALRAVARRRGRVLRRALSRTMRRQSRKGARLGRASGRAARFAVRGAVRTVRALPVHVRDGPAIRARGRRARNGTPDRGRRR